MSGRNELKGCAVSSITPVIFQSIGTENWGLFVHDTATHRISELATAATVSNNDNVQHAGLHRRPQKPLVGNFYGGLNCMRPGEESAFNRKNETAPRHPWRQRLQPAAADLAPTPWAGTFTTACSATTMLRSVSNASRRCRRGSSYGTSSKIASGNIWLACYGEGILRILDRSQLHAPADISGKPEPAFAIVRTGFKAHPSRHRKEGLTAAGIDDLPSAAGPRPKGLPGQWPVCRYPARRALRAECLVSSTLAFTMRRRANPLHQPYHRRRIAGQPGSTTTLRPHRW